MTYIDAPFWEYDIFFSYARADDQGLPWVSQFRARLMADIQRYITQPVKYFWDTQTSENPVRGMFGDIAARSAILVAVTSRQYLTRSECKNEFVAFSESHSDKQSVFPVQITSLDDEVPPFAGMEAVYPSIFFHVDGDNEDRFAIDDERFLDALAQLRSRIVNKLGYLKAQAKNGTLKSPVALVKDSVAAPVVMVAESEKALRPQEVNVKSQLRQAGFIVLPEADYPIEAEAFKKAFVADLERCHVFVQLLGGTRGRFPRGVSEGIVRHQSDAAEAFASEHPGAITLLRWQCPQLDLDEINLQDPEYCEFLQDVAKKVMAIEAFKTMVEEKARAALEPEPEPEPCAGLHDTAGQELFLCVDPCDLPAARALVPHLDPHFMPIQYSVAKDKVADYDAHLMERFRRAKAVAVLQGDAPVTWVQSSLGLFFAAFGEKSATRALPRAIVCQGPPPPKDPELPGYYRHVGRVDCTNGWDAERIVAELLQSPDGGGAGGGGQ